MTIDPTANPLARKGEGGGDNRGPLKNRDRMLRHGRIGQELWRGECVGPWALLLLLVLNGCYPREPRLVGPSGAAPPGMFAGVNRFFIATPHRNNYLGKMLEMALRTEITACVDDLEFVEEPESSDAEISLVTFPAPVLHQPVPRPTEGYLWIQLDIGPTFVLYRKNNRSCETDGCFYRLMAKDFAEAWCAGSSSHAGIVFIRDS